MKSESMPLRGELQTNTEHVLYAIQASKLTLASSHFASGLHQTVSAKLYHTHFSATRTLAL